MTTVMGAAATAELKVAPRLLVPAFADVFPGWTGMPNVLATIMVIGLMEEACVRAIHPLLPSAQTTLGFAIDIRHLAPTPEGFSLRASAQVIGIEGNRVTFSVECSDESQVIASGHHTRVIVNRARFLDSVETKKRMLDSS